MRIRRSHVCRILAALILMTLPGGCNSPMSESSPREAYVRGVVKVRGQPIAGGELHFNASSPNRKVEIRDATINPDGRYAVKACIGLNIVNLTPPKPRNSAQRKAFFGVGYEDKPVQVHSGDNEVDLDFLTP